MVDGGRVRYWRLAQALTQQELARRACTTNDAISEIEQGKRQPRPALLRRLADALDVDVWRLLKELGEGG